MTTATITQTKIEGVILETFVQALLGASGLTHNIPC